MDNQADNKREIRYIVSACLVGLRTRYDGTSKPCETVKALVRDGVAVPFCPEQCGGLPTPRPAAEIAGGDGHDVLAGRARVVDIHGVDVTGAFKQGAQDMLKLARMYNATHAILVPRSPSCGVGAIYDGSFSGTIVKGDGVAAALLKESGLAVGTEKEFTSDTCDG